MDTGNKITDSQTQNPVYDLHTTSQSYIMEDIPVSEPTPPIQAPPSQIIIVGTAHVSEKSVAEVIETIEREKPDIVAVELCKGRYDAIKGKAGVSKIPIKDLLSEGKVYFFLVHWLLAYVQKKIGDDMGVKPGAEMISAIDAAERSGASVALIDRDIQVTLQRFWGKMGLIEKLRMGGALVGAALGFGGGTDIDIDNITDQDMITMLIGELRGIAPTAAEVLIDERDAYIAGNLVRAAAGGGKKIVAVVGAGHRSGIEKYLKAPQTIPAPRSLMAVPKKRFGVMKLIGFGIVGIAIATFALLIMSGTSLKLLLIAFGWWFIINGVLSAAGAILARGHPYSVLTAFSVAWLTSLNPMMGAGWFAGLMEAKQRNPTTEDFKMLMEVESTGEMMNNGLFRVILVAAFANIGSMIGTFLGVYVMMQVAGIDPREVIRAGFAGIGF
ncbi:MAG TPA: TraB/GumN family protein [Methanosarcinaceae archaeon]|nr:TraB/GumN family protein [Methanosarcinaceae archaeon]